MRHDTEHIRADACVYDCRVMHARRFPVRYRFCYRVFYLLLDIDRLRESTRSRRLFSYNRLNLFSFHDRDHGPRDGSPLRPWVERILKTRDVDLAGGKIRLLSMPRVLGYVFNPISIYYCYHSDATLRAIICQVHNTFGEQHCYVLDNTGGPLREGQRFNKDKVFHVSPLMDKDSRYRFALGSPAEQLQILIRVFRDGGLLLNTTLSGRRLALNDRILLNRFVRIPLMTFKVIAAIHWQALKIWLLGAPFFKKPDSPRQEIS